MIEFDEFIKVMSLNNKKDLLRLIFEIFDKDNKGTIYREEFKQLLNRIKEDVSNVEAEGVFKKSTWTKTMK